LAKSAGKKRVTIIPAVHGKLTYDGKVCEPDIAWLIEKWLDRHPEIRKRRHEIRALGGRWTTEDGLRPEVVTVSILAGDGIAGYDPEEDADIYEYWKAEDRYWKQE
jgi:hypothetical protein